MTIYASGVPGGFGCCASMPIFIHLTHFEHVCNIYIDHAIELCWFDPISDVVMASDVAVCYELLAASTIMFNNFMGILMLSVATEEASVGIEVSAAADEVH